MITALIFFGHLLFLLIVFTKKWQDDNLSTAMTNVALVVILFFVGWTITGQGSKIFMEQKGFGIYFDRDAFALALLSIGEYFFYRMYFRGLIKQTKKPA